MTTKKIDKVIIYYNDGTFEEVKTGIYDVAPKQNTEPVNTTGQVNFPYYPPGVRASGWPNDCYKYIIATNSNDNVDVSNNNSRKFT